MDEKPVDSDGSDKPQPKFAWRRGELFIAPGGDPLSGRKQAALYVGRHSVRWARQLRPLLALIKRKSDREPANGAADKSLSVLKSRLAAAKEQLSQLERDQGIEADAWEQYKTAKKSAKKGNFNSESAGGGSGGGSDEENGADLAIAKRAMPAPVAPASVLPLAAGKVKVKRKAYQPAPITSIDDCDWGGDDDFLAMDLSAFEKPPQGQQQLAEQHRQATASLGVQGRASVAAMSGSASSSPLIGSVPDAAAVMAQGANVGAHAGGYNVNCGHPVALTADRDSIRSSGGGISSSTAKPVIPSMPLRPTQAHCSELPLPDISLLLEERQVEINSSRFDSPFSLDCAAFSVEHPSARAALNAVSQCVAVAMVAGNTAIVTRSICGLSEPYQSVLNTIGGLSAAQFTSALRWGGRLPIHRAFSADCDDPAAIDEPVTVNAAGRVQRWASEYSSGDYEQHFHCARCSAESCLDVLGLGIREDECSCPKQQQPNDDVTDYDYQYQCDGDAGGSYRYDVCAVNGHDMPNYYVSHNGYETPAHHSNMVPAGVYDSAVISDVGAVGYYDVARAAADDDFRYFAQYPEQQQGGFGGRAQLPLHSDFGGITARDGSRSSAAAADKASQLPQEHPQQHSSNQQSNMTAAPEDTLDLFCADDEEGDHYAGFDAPSSAAVPLSREQQRGGAAESSYYPSPVARRRNGQNTPPFSPQTTRL